MSVSMFRELIPIGLLIVLMVLAAQSPRLFTQDGSVQMTKRALTHP